MGETAERRGRCFVGHVGGNGCGGALGGLCVLRLGEEFDQCGGDFFGRGLDRHAYAGTELDDAPGVEVLVASKSRRQSRSFGISSACVAPR
jgi:hypothetical protein